MRPLEVIEVARIVARGGPLRRTAGRCMVCCPAHPDRRPSLALSRGHTGRVIAHCFAGCTWGELRRAFAQLGLDLVRDTAGESPRESVGYRPHPNEEDAWRPAAVKAAPARRRLRHARLGEPVQHWTYRAPTGEVLAAVARYATAEGKEYRPWSPWRNARGARTVWRCKAPPRPRPLYGAQRLAAHPDAPVLVVEGEKTADGAQHLFPDFVAVSPMTGWGGLVHAAWGPLAGRRVTLVPDRDKAEETANEDDEEALVRRWRECLPTVEQVRTVTDLARTLPLAPGERRHPRWDLADAWEAGLRVAAVRRWRAALDPAHPLANG